MRIIFVMLFSMSVLIAQAAIGVLNNPVDLPEVQKGYKYSSSAGMVKVTFPAEYEEEYSDEEYGKSYTVKAVNGSDIFMLNFVVHDEYMGGSDLVLLAETSLEAFADAMGGEIKRSFDYDYKKYQGKGAEIDYAGTLVTYRCIIIGQIQYQLVTITAPENADVAAEFVKSFKSFSK